MTEEEQIKVCEALIFIVDMECSTYGQDEAVSIAEKILAEKFRD